MILNLVWFVWSATVDSFATLNYWYMDLQIKADSKQQLIFMPAVDSNS